VDLDRVGEMHIMLKRIAGALKHMQSELGPPETFTGYLALSASRNTGSGSGTKPAATTPTTTNGGTPRTWARESPKR